MFKNLKKYEVTSDLTAWFELPEAGHPLAAVQVRPATSVNKPYHSAVLRDTVKKARRGSIGRVTEKDYDRMMERDAELYPKFVMCGFRNIPDDAHPGKFVDFSVEAAQMLVAELPDHLFESLRTFAGASESFYPDEVDDPAGSDPEAVEVIAEN